MLDYSVYLVTDDPSRYAGNWLDNVVAAVEGGVSCVQYRDTENAPREQYARLRMLRDALRGRAPIVVNNDPELARAVAAAGVHVGQSDMSPDAVRKIVGTGCEIGLSITDIAQTASSRCADADVFGIGPVFDATGTKRDAAPALGTGGLARILNALSGRPCVAIGGIAPDRAIDVLKTGVGGIALVSAFSKAEDPYGVAAGLRALFEER